MDGRWLVSEGHRFVVVPGLGLIKQSKELSEKMERERAQQSAGKNFVQTIEFDEILFTTSAAGLPLQLHLRAKLVEQPVTKNRRPALKSISLRERYGSSFTLGDLRAMVIYI